MSQTVELSHLGGYELLRDGSKEDGTFDCVDDLREYLENNKQDEFVLHGIEFAYNTLKGHY